MADDLEPVEQRFVAEVEDYIDEVHRAAADVRDFADGNEEAKVAIDGLRDHAVEAGEALGHVRDEALEAAEAEKKLGTAAEETAYKLDLMSLAGASTVTSLGPLLGIIGAIVIAAAAVAPAVAGMGLGFAAFGAFAIPTLMQISGAMQAVSTQQAVLNSATSTSKQRATALSNEQKIWASMPAPIRDVVHAIQGLQGAWQAAGKVFQPEVLTAIDEALSIAGDLMKEIVPLAVQGGYAVNGMLMQIKAGIDSSGFHQFLQVMTRLVVPATQAITRLAFTILGVLGNALEQLAPLSVPFINFVSVLIKALGGPATAALRVIISLFLGLAQALEPLLPGLSKLATLLIGDIGSSFASFIPIIQRVVAILGGAFLQILTELEPLIANALTPNSPFMLALGQLPAILSAILPLFTGFASVLSNPAVAQAAVWAVSLLVAFKSLMGVVGLLGAAFEWLVGLPELIMGCALATDIATVATGAWAVAQSLLDAVMDANPIGLIIIAIAALIGVIVLIVTHLHLFAEAFDVVRHAVAAAADDIVRAFKMALGWIESHWKAIVAWLVDPMGMAVHEILTHTHQIAQEFDKMRHDVARILDGARHDIAAAFDGVRHDIAAFADWVPRELERGWDNARHGTAAAFDGLRHETAVLVDDVLRFFSRLPGQILGFLASLPGKMLTAGKNIIDGLIHGIVSAAGDIPSLMGGLASDVESYFTDPLKMFSPSRKFFEHGVNTVLGYMNGVKSLIPQLQALMRGVGSGVATGGAGGLAGPAAGGYGGSGHISVSVPLTAVFGAGTGSLATDPRFMQFIQAAVQEAVARWSLSNPGTGFGLPGRA